MLAEIDSLDLRFRQMSQDSDDQTTKEEREQKRRDLAEKIEALSLRIGRMSSEQLDKTSDCLAEAVREMVDTEKISQS